MGIDHGLKRIGIAISDATGMIARELSVIHRTSKREDFVRIQTLIDQHHPVALVIGFPQNLDLLERNPGAHTQADTVLKWVEALKESIALPIVLWDEGMSSVDALELAKARKRKIGEPIDDLAARVILQSYLDALHDGLAHPPGEE